MKTSPQGHFLQIGQLNLYYENHGQGTPLVLIHGGGSTIQTTFGRILPQLAKSFRIIAVELQAHGRTADIDRPLSFEQDADDVAALLNHLQISKASLLGFSNGGTTCLQIAIRHPHLVDKLVLLAAAYKRDGLINGFFEGMQHVTIEHMPQPLKDAFLAVNPDEEALMATFNRDKNRMLAFEDIPDELIRSIQAPTLVINGDKEVITADHALEISRTLPNASLAILPAGHGEYIGEICTTAPDSRMPELVTVMIEEFLAK